MDMRSARLSKVILLAVILLAALGYFCSAFPLWAQTSDSPSSDASKSWTDLTQSQSDGANPTRCIETHTQSGNRTVDNQSLQRRDADGNFEPYQDIEKTTVKVDTTTTRTTTRTYGRDADGAKTLVQVTEEDTHTQPGGDSSVVRSTSNPDANGNLQLVQREIEETKKSSKDVEETKKTVMLPGAEGGLIPTMMVQERRTQQGKDIVELQKTTLLPDVNGNWQVSEVEQATTRQDGSNRTTEERISRPDANGKLAEVSRTVSTDSADSANKSSANKSSANKSSSVETYSIDVPGAPRDGSLHLVERATTNQSTSPTGQQNTIRQIERPDPGDPGAGLRVTILTTDTVRPGPSGAQATQTIQMRDANGSFGVVSVDTAKSDNIHAVQVQIAPSGPPK
jgi:hypothetical protein